MYQRIVEEKISLLKKKKEELIKNIKDGEEAFIVNDELIHQTEKMLIGIAQVFSSICTILAINRLGRIPKHSFESLELLIKGGYISAKSGSSLYRLFRFLNFYYDFASLKEEDVYRISVETVSLIEKFSKEVEKIVKA